MTKLLGFLVVLCSIAAACGSSDTTTTVLEPVADPGAAEDPGPETPDTTTTVLEPVADPGAAEDPGPETPDTTTTVLKPVADPGAAEDPGPETPDTTTTVLEPVADRLPADPEAPATDWVAGINAAGWDFHRHLMGNAVSSPMSIGTAFSMSRAGASPDSGTALDKIFGFPETGLHEAANAVDLSLAEASVGSTTLEVANRLFPDDGFSPLAEFLHTAAAQYGAVIQPDRHRRRRRRGRHHQQMGVAEHPRTHPHNRHRRTSSEASS